MTSAIPGPDDVFEQYDIILAKREGQWVARVPALHLAAVGESADVVIDALRERIAALLRDLEDAQALDDLPAPQRIRGHRTNVIAAPWWDVRGFLLRFVLVLAVIGVGAGIGVHSLDKAKTALSHQVAAAVDRMNEKVDDRLSRLRSKVGWRALDAALADWAENGDLSPEKREQVIHELRTIVARLKPFADELAPLFSGPDQTHPTNSR